MIFECSAQVWKHAADMGKKRTTVIISNYLIHDLPKFF